MAGRVALYSAAALLVLLPGLAGAEAAHGEAHGHDWTLLALQALNTGILVFVLVRYARRPLNDFLVQRSRGIRQEIERGELRLNEARSQLDSLRARLARLDEESAALVSDAETRAHAERVLILERAERISERLRGEAERVADREVDRARLALREEAAELAVALAAELVRDEMEPGDDARLVREYTDRVGPDRVGRNGGSA